MNSRTFLGAYDLDKDQTALFKALIQAHENWAIVLDNYNTISVDVKPFLLDNVVRFVITSRDRRATGLVTN